MTDRLGTLHGRITHRIVVKIGGLDVSHAVVGGSISGGIGKLSTAEVRLDTRETVLAELNLAAVLTIGHVVEGRHQLQFSGSVIGATLDDGEYVLECMSSPQFVEGTTNAMVSRSVAELQLLHLIARDAGLDESGIDIEGLEEQPHEVFEVVVPVVGLRLSEQRTLAGASYFGHAHARAAVNGLEGDVVDAFLSFSTYAATYVTHRLWAEAERTGLHHLRSSVAWLHVRWAFPSPTLPGGQFVDWLRPRRRQSVSMRPYTCVRCVRTGALWVRALDSSRPLGAQDVDLRSLAIPSVGLEWPPSLRLAVEACHRAIGTADPLLKTTVLWESIEFIAGSVELPTLFGKSVRKAVLRRAISGLSEAEARRVRDVLALLNHAPLMAKLRRRVADLGIPISEDDFEILRGLRKARNDIVHGSYDLSTSQYELEEMVDAGIAIVSKLLTYEVDHCFGEFGYDDAFD
ncbi:hypothetical protein [Euzebya rosea]|uniref:hypothetical protein n=1 Tax=Euzebya rosea TaxID=2052804 RepID=UPI0013001EE6|nr:hypothetical protein [Euzebya rosea]